MRRYLLALAAATLIVAGCSQQRAPATKALESVEKSLSAVKDDAARYAPEGLKSVEAQYDRLKASLDMKEYDNVLAGAPQLEKAVASLEDAVAASKAQAHAATAAAKSEWASLSTEVPKLVDSIQTRVDELSSKKHLPWGVSKDEFEGAKTGLDSMKSTWVEASKDYKNGKQPEAVEKARSVKQMAEQIREQLKIKEA